MRELTTFSILITLI